jgi:Flp pilus assembly protein TadD
LARGIACIEQGDFEAARRHLNVSKRLQPQDIEVVVQCYPRLMEAGETRFAEELFNEYQQTLLEQIKAWPNDSTALNNLAWMYARSNRNLTEALPLAQRGVELAPHSPVFLDTLAEVKYRLGMIDEAIEDMRGCVRLDPRSPNYRANLVRFRDGR